MPPSLCTQVKKKRNPTYLGEKDGELLRENPGTGVEVILFGEKLLHRPHGAAQVDLPCHFGHAWWGRGGSVGKGRGPLRCLSPGCPAKGQRRWHCKPRCSPPQGTLPRVLRFNLCLPDGSGLLYPWVTLLCCPTYSFCFTVLSIVCLYKWLHQLPKGSIKLIDLMMTN